MAWPYFYPTQLRPQAFGSEESWWSPLTQQQPAQQQGQPGQPQGQPQQQQQAPDMNPFSRYKFRPNGGQ